MAKIIFSVHDKNYSGLSNVSVSHIWHGSPVKKGETGNDGKLQIDTDNWLEETRTYLFEKPGYADVAKPFSIPGMFGNREFEILMMESDDPNLTPTGQIKHDFFKVLGDLGGWLFWAIIIILLLLLAYWIYKRQQKKKMNFNSMGL